MPGCICRCRGAPGQGDPAAAATKGTGREFIPPGFAPRDCAAKLGGEKIVSAGAFDSKIYIYIFFFPL